MNFVSIFCTQLDLDPFRSKLKQMRMFAFRFLKLADKVSLKLSFFSAVLVYFVPFWYKAAHCNLTDAFQIQGRLSCVHFITVQ